MARRHFDERGYPQLDLIANEIAVFFNQFNGFSDKLAAYAVARHMPANIGELLAEPKWEGYFALTLLKGPPKLPKDVVIDDIYVWGSQAEVLPDSYLTGPHDLDLKIVTNLELLAGNKDSEKLMQMLRYGLNGPDTATIRDHFLDVVYTDAAEKIRKPCFSIGIPSKPTPLDTRLFFDYV